MNNGFTIEGNLVDLQQERTYPAEVTVEGERIVSIKELDNTSSSQFILPGFIDAHVHVESSMLIPSEFARLAVVHGSVATISDPHEIANVCGLKGVEYMIEDGNTVPFKFYFGAPSCVPATIFETAGAAIDSTDIDHLLQREDIVYLTEMMNFPGVLNHDPEVMKKLESAKKYNKPVDGHAPGLTGETAKQYIDAGISTDHECFTKEEALDKLKHGMKILIREGSAAKNFEALIDLLKNYPDEIMFCSDDKHPDSLVAGHINQLCERAVAKGINVFNVLKAACVNPVKHYKLKVGQLKANDFADFIVVNDLKNFHVTATYINGQLVAENGTTLIKKGNSPAPVNNFHCSPKKVEDFVFRSDEFNFDTGKLPVIEALDGQLITPRSYFPVSNNNGVLAADVTNDILKIVVINRYKDAPVAKAFIRNFGLKSGAIASSVAHDSHNIVAVGVDEESLCKAVNAVIENKGGVSCFSADHQVVLPLPVGGLMSTEDGYKVAEMYSHIDKAAKELGSKLSAPFMTLSFMALLVIPHLKLSDLGLFDGDRFSFISNI